MAEFLETSMNPRADPRQDAVTVEQVASRLGLGEEQAAWLAALDAACPETRLSAPTPTALEALLPRLDIEPEAGRELIRTLPQPDRDPETWWLLERSHRLLKQALSNPASGFEPIPRLPSLLKFFPAHLVLVNVKAALQRHREMGVTEDVSWETVSWLGRAMARQSPGEGGIWISRWDWLHYTGALFEVGRLQVTPYRLRLDPNAGPLFWYDDETMEQLGPGFRKGDPVLGLHIPATGRLLPAECNESIGRMGAAFAGMYPGEPVQIATCTSWLMDDQLADVLGPDSNIVAFQRRFEMVPGARDNDDSILHYVFGDNRPKELEALPRRTTLERAVVRHLQAGLHWRARTGWRWLDGSHDPGRTAGPGSS
jgi:hypothetical protein